MCPYHVQLVVSDVTEIVGRSVKSEIKNFLIGSLQIYSVD